MLYVRNNLKGFSLIEVLVVIAIIFILAGISISGWRSISEGINLKNAIQMIETQVKLARNYSLSALDDNNYGIRFEPDKITLYNSTTSTDMTPYDLSSGVEIYNIALSGAGGGPSCNNDGVLNGDEIGIDCGGSTCLACSSNLVFNRLTGTSNSGTFSIRLTGNPSKSEKLYVNNQGQVSMGDFQASTGTVVLEDTVNSINARHIHFNLDSWTIQDGPPTVTNLIFRKSDNTLIDNISISSSFFTGGVFNWEGAVTIDGVAQRLRVHTLSTAGNILCVIRDRTQNSKSIKISFMYGGYEEKVVTYTENMGGTVTVSPDLDVLLPIDPQ